MPESIAVVDAELWSVLPPETPLTDYCGENYRRWETEIATPALEHLGYRVDYVHTGDGDSFGPLVRCVVAMKAGLRYRLTYG